MEVVFVQMPPRTAEEIAEERADFEEINKLWREGLPPKQKKEKAKWTKKSTG